MLTAVKGTEMASGVSTGLVRDIVIKRRGADSIGLQIFSSKRKIERGCTVSSVAPGSASDLSGLKQGDVIVMVQDWFCVDASNKEIADAFKAAGMTISVKVTRREHLETVIASLQKTASTEKTTSSKQNMMNIMFMEPDRDVSTPVGEEQVLNWAQSVSESMQEEITDAKLKEIEDGLVSESPTRPAQEPIKNETEKKGTSSQTETGETPSTAMKRATEKEIKEKKPEVKKTNTIVVPKGETKSSYLRKEATKKKSQKGIKNKDTFKKKDSTKGRKVTSPGPSKPTATLEEAKGLVGAASPTPKDPTSPTVEHANNDAKSEAGNGEVMSPKLEKKKGKSKRWKTGGPSAMQPLGFLDVSPSPVPYQQLNTVLMRNFDKVDPSKDWRGPSRGDIGPDGKPLAVKTRFKENVRLRAKHAAAAAARQEASAELARKRASLRVKAHGARNNLVTSPTTPRKSVGLTRRRDETPTTSPGPYSESSANDEHLQQLRLAADKRDRTDLLEELVQLTESYDKLVAATEKQIDEIQQEHSEVQKRLEGELEEKDARITRLMNNEDDRFKDTEDQQSLQDEVAELRYVVAAMEDAMAAQEKLLNIKQQSKEEEMAALEKHHHAALTKRDQTIAKLRAELNYLSLQEGGTKNSGDEQSKKSSDDMKDLKRRLQAALEEDEATMGVQFSSIRDVLGTPPGSAKIRAPSSKELSVELRETKQRVQEKEKKIQEEVGKQEMLKISLSKKQKEFEDKKKKLELALRKILTLEKKLNTKSAEAGGSPNRDLARAQAIIAALEEAAAAKDRLLQTLEIAHNEERSNWDTRIKKMEAELNERFERKVAESMRNLEANSSMRDLESQTLISNLQLEKEQAEKQLRLIQQTATQEKEEALQEQQGKFETVMIEMREALDEAISAKGDLLHLVQKKSHNADSLRELSISLSKRGPEETAALVLGLQQQLARAQEEIAKQEQQHTNFQHIPQTPQQHIHDHGNYEYTIRNTENM
eukprot:m.142029 g.142029  ORF g.142029 m.142029 type:complete len:992 (+) comp14871_c0_seq1:221-3196(+)